MGYSYSWTDSTTKFSSTNYNDKDWNYLGGSFDDPANGFSGSNFSTVKKDGGKITGYVDTGTDKQVDSDGKTVFERSFNYEFDADYNLVKGTETENGVEITYGKDWEITARKASILTDGKLKDLAR